MITVFDDFNGQLKGTEGFGDNAVWEDSGWELADIGTPTNDEVSLNDASNTDVWAPSCIRIYSGDADDAGGNMQLDLITGEIGTLVGTCDFPHLVIPETDAGAAALDDTVWVFACRVGLRADLTTTGSGDWDSKFFIGWAQANDAQVMTAATGAITIASTGALVGFHINETGCIDGISHRTAATVMAEGTNYTRLGAAGTVDGTVANGAVTAGDTMWFDLALRMKITDQSDDTDNGETQFFWRQVPKVTGAPGDRDGDLPGEGIGQMTVHPTVLLNQTPNSAVGLVPTIEMINGPTAGRDGVAFVDWWAMGCSRYSRK
jgi:hypothetical protein